MPGAERLNGNPHCRSRFQNLPYLHAPTFPSTIRREIKRSFRRGCPERNVGVKVSSASDGREFSKDKGGTRATTATKRVQPSI